MPNRLFAALFLAILALPCVAQDLAYRVKDPAVALEPLRDALLSSLRAMPGMESGYPRAAVIIAEPVPGRDGEQRLRFVASEDHAACCLLLDSLGSGLPLAQTGGATARVRLYTVHLLPQQAPILMGSQDRYRYPQIEIGWPMLAEGCRLELPELERRIGSGLRGAGAEELGFQPLP